MITSRPTNQELGGNSYDLRFLIDSQALSLTGNLDFFRIRNVDKEIPLEEWNAINPDFVSNSTNKQTQLEKRDKRIKFTESVNWVYGSPQEVNKTVMPFRLEVNPRIQFFVHITLDGANGVLTAEYYNQAHSTRDDDRPARFNVYDSFDGGFNRWRGSSLWGFGWLDVGMVEGDYIQWDGEFFDVVHYGQIIYRSNTISPNNYIIPLGASELQQTEAQAQEQGRMDDPLTPEDETVDLSEGDGFRPDDFNKKRIEKIRRALRYRNGNQVIGSLFLALLSYSALIIIRRGS